MSLAAGLMARATGQREHGPAHVQAAHDQHTKAGMDKRAPGSAPVKKDAKPHRTRASLHGWHGRARGFEAAPLDAILTLACKPDSSTLQMST